MGPWPLARFGAAAELLGRRDAISHPLVAALGAELLRQTRVVLGCDLESIGLTTHLEPGGDAIARGAHAVELASGADARTFVEGRATSPSGVAVTAMVLASGAAYSIEHGIVGAVAQVAGERGASDSVAREASARLGPLAQSVDHVVEHWASSGARSMRIGASTDNPNIVAGILERSRIAEAQQRYFADTFPVWSSATRSMLVRVAFDASGIVDEVGVVFRDVPGEHLVRAWRTFRPRTDVAQRIGAFVGAMGIENADRFELRLQHNQEPVLEASYVPADTAFSR